MKSSKVSIKTRSTPASLTFKGQATKHTTVKWSIEIFCSCTIFVFFFLYSSFFFLGTCGVLVATFLYGVPERSQAAEVKPV